MRSIGVLVFFLAGCPKEMAPEVIEPEVSPEVEVPLIPRADLFGNPERGGPSISPDGATLGFRAPVDGVMNVWLTPVGDLDAASPLTADTGRGIRIWRFLPNGTHLMYVQDENGDENWRLHLVDLETGEDRVVTPEEPGVTVRLWGTSPDEPDTMMIGLNDRDPTFHDVYRLDIVSGERELVYENSQYVGFLFDESLQMRMAAEQTADGGTAYHLREGEAFSPFLTFGQVDNMVSGVEDVHGDRVLMIDSRDRDTGALVSLDLETGEQTVLGQSDKADISNVIISDVTHEVLAYAVNHERSTWTALDDEVAADLAIISAAGDGELFMTSATADERVSVWGFVPSDGPVHYAIFDRDTKAVTPLYASRPGLSDAPLVPMEPVVIPSRDGLELVSYLSLPKGSDADGDGRPEAAVPMVLVVHGGPWGRDSFGYNSLHQLLANRGYAALSVNFRGSTGFGKSFVNAGDLEWGAKMHDDLLDAVQWAVDAGIAPADQVAILGGSYGGYATLVGLTFTPEQFACGVDIVGPSNLETLLATIPPYWKPLMETFASRVGDPRTEEGMALLRERSPLHRVDAITKPLLIGQGANDPRVKQAESDQIVEAMQGKSIPVTYALFPDEGHGFARPENNMAFWAVTEAFLGSCLGGRVEPFGDVLGASTVQVPAGAEHVPGLAEALPAAPAEEMEAPAAPE